MPHDPTRLTKFRALRHIDRWSSDPTDRAARYDAALARLDDPAFDILGATVAGVEAIASGADAAPDPLEHLDAHWLSGAYFPNVDGGDIRSAIRTGFRDAIADARAADRPLDVVWVCLSDDPADPHFGVHHVVGDVAVTVVITTPRPLPMA